MKLCKNCGSTAEFPSGKCKCGSQNIIFIVDTSQWYNMSLDERQNKIMNILNVDANQFEIIEDMWSGNKTYLSDCDKIKAEQKGKEQYIPHCPTCGSTNVEPISHLRKLGGLLTIGLASKSVGKTYRCLNCKYYW